MQNIILLHGALGAPQDLAPLAAVLKAGGLAVHSFPFSGHAGASFEQHFGVPHFSRELQKFINNRQLNGAHIFGYSMGGYVALNLARETGSALGNIITLGTKFNWSKEAVEKETAALNPEKIEQKVPVFAALLQSKHGAGWKELVLKTAGLMRELSQLDLLNATSLATLQNKTLLGLADKDQMVSLEETTATFKALPNAQMYMLPGTRHQVETANAELLGNIILSFLNKP